MESYVKNIEIRWSDLDPNFHVLHSKYYDFGAYCRMAYFEEQGLTQTIMQQYNIGPVLFREECFFKREIAFGDKIKINFFLKGHTTNYGKWFMYHEIWKNEDTLAAIINIDGAWMDTIKRKLAIPPDIIHSVFNNAPRPTDFEVHEK